MGLHRLGCLARGPRPGGGTDRLGDLEPEPDPPGRLVGPDARGGARPGDRGDRPPDSRPPTRPGPGGPARGDGAVLVPGRAHPDGDATGVRPPCAPRVAVQGLLAAGPAPRGPGSTLVLPGADAGEVGDDGRGDGQGRPSPGGRDGPARRSLAGPARPIRDLADRLVSGAALRPAAVRHLRHGDRVSKSANTRAEPTA